MKLSTNGWIRNFSFPDSKKIRITSSSLEHLKGQFGLNRKKSTNTFPWICKRAIFVSLVLVCFIWKIKSHVWCIFMDNYNTCSPHSGIKQRSSKYVTASGQYCIYIRKTSVPGGLWSGASSLAIFENWFSWSDISWSCTLWAFAALLSKMIYKLMA